jgi:hypothetical protein
LNVNYTSNGKCYEKLIAIMSWANFYKNFTTTNVTKWSWANYYKNACANKVSKVSPLY